MARREGWEWVRNMEVLIARPLSVTSTVKTLNWNSGVVQHRDDH